MKDLLITIAIIIAAGAGCYKLGYNRAETRHRIEATTATKNVTDAVTRASEALSGAANNLDVVEESDRDLLKEIEDEASARGAVCAVPVERLRVLDAIGR